jgi:hypothetical protein
MAGLGRRTWTAGEVATAANIQSYLQDQVVQVYAGTAARSSALGTAVSEGMVSYLSDSNSLQYYDGSSWSNVSASASGTTVSAAYTAVAGDANNTIVANGTAAYTITIPDILSTWGRIDVIRDSSGTVSIAAGTGVTTWAGAGTAGTAVTFKIDTQYSGATIEKVAANSYRVIGKITV